MDVPRRMFSTSGHLIAALIPYPNGWRPRRRGIASSFCCSVAWDSALRDCEAPKLRVTGRPTAKTVKNRLHTLPYSHHERGL
jgi:hypothetical protein